MKKTRCPWFEIDFKPFGASVPVQIETQLHAQRSITYATKQTCTHAKYTSTRTILRYDYVTNKVTSHTPGTDRDAHVMHTIEVGIRLTIVQQKPNVLTWSVSLERLSAERLRLRKLMRESFPNAILNTLDF